MLRKQAAHRDGKYQRERRPCQDTIITKAIHEIFSPRGELVVEGPWPARTGAIQVSRTQQKSLNASIARPNSPSARRIRRQSRVCMCKAPLPGYPSTATPLPARSPAMAVDLLVALGGQLVQMRGKDQGVGAAPGVNQG